MIACTRKPFLFLWVRRKIKSKKDFKTLDLQKIELPLQLILTQHPYNNGLT